ncbi:MAG: hypothetical protein WC738_07585, partial [Candidatus Omnitrophota bacterium]
GKVDTTTTYTPDNKILSRTVIVYNENGVPIYTIKHIYDSDGKPHIAKERKTKPYHQGDIQLPAGVIVPDGSYYVETREYSPDGKEVLVTKEIEVADAFNKIIYKTIDETQTGRKTIYSYNIGTSEMKEELYVNGTLAHTKLYYVFRVKDATVDERDWQLLKETYPDREVTYSYGAMIEDGVFSSKRPIMKEVMSRATGKVIERTKFYYDNFRMMTYIVTDSMEGKPVDILVMNELDTVRIPDGEGGYTLVHFPREQWEGELSFEKVKGISFDTDQAVPSINTAKSKLVATLGYQNGLIYKAYRDGVADGYTIAYRPNDL